MSRIILVVTALALLITDTNAVCSQTNENHRKACELWNELSLAFQKSGWSKCASFATDEGPCNNNCPQAQGYITCSSFAITSINVGSGDGWVYDQAYDIENLNTAIANMGTVSSISMPDIAGLNLNQCLDVCSSATCDFSNSGCTGACTSDGVCVTEPPTLAPTLEPTSSPTDSPTPAPTNPPTEMNCDYKAGYRYRNCRVWNLLADAFQADGWNKCGDFRNTDPCSYGACPKKEGLVRCYRGRITVINFIEENGLSYDGSTDLGPLQDALLELKRYHRLRLILIRRQASLNLNQCLPTICNTLRCRFTRSTCTGQCTNNGRCLE
ncbi:Hypothetical Protein FCC1311_009772 [Hondaea fermentalgiana]|uniref:Uncharacterized protein n=1 Tax=Hondaea fermentalgiana TaxID=2315210 RepID=A0A2R5G359_9STRA|nr:Hypothetical Protein FCC1311_009772 [Hondaea fermentalgiana]|eukprot:GBG24759.1 Hypothetical Protein FCC1311_009772 [Hondaea fermentalgiana]